MKKYLHLSITYILFLCFSMAHAEQLLFTDHALVGKFWDTHSHSFIDEATLLSGLNAVDVLLLGETHDNPAHHEFQQKILQARLDAGARPALLMEQLDRDSQPALNAALANTNRDEALSLVKKLIKFSNWQSYIELLTIAYDHQLPVIAANVSSQYLQPVIWRGFAALDEGEIQHLAIDTVWDEPRQKYLQRHMGGAHCGQLREELRVGLTRSQRLRDAQMVDSGVSSIDRGIIAVIGRDHARLDVGLPIYFAARAPAARVVTMGLVEVLPGMIDPQAYLGESASDQAPFDVLWFSARVNRPDPCAEMNK